MLKIGNIKKKISNDDKIKWNPYYKVFPITPNEVYITHGLRSTFSFSILDELELKILDKIVNYLQNFISLEELFEILKIKEENKNYLEEILNSLYEKGIIIKEKDSQILYAVYFEEISKLQHINIGLIGLGPLGIRNLFSFLSLEINTVNVIDGRENIPYEACSNYTLFFKDFIETSKSPSEALKKFLSKHPQYTDKIKIFDNFEKENLIEFLKSSNMVIISLESYLPKLFNEINSLAFEFNTPVLYSFIEGGVGIIGPLVIPRETSCFLCFMSQFEASLLLPSHYLAYKSYMNKIEKSGKTLIGGSPPILDIISGFIVDCGIRILLGLESAYTINRILILNFESLEMEIQDVLKNPSCPTCLKGEPPIMASSVL